MRRAVYPGTFDPITFGHLNILEKAAKMFDEVILAVADFTGKNTLFDLAERTSMCRIATSHLSNVVVDSFDGLIVDYTRKKESAVMIRGMRAVSDFEYELALALTNKKLAPDIETIFLVPNLRYMYQSSSLIKQLALLSSALDDYVPACVIKAFETKKK
ncbi:MAG: pantetheine-phosphate adenylyltransferase [Candidatus Cloacimonetes bacterium HGW-Cloacimonetes-1]|nr:MAG: pantetheine-phosphate adenylyltransferase [Candidatus Cloacimonetes bacterium HGW-Cloacimonetes-1]